VVLDVHPVDELRLPGQVDVVGACLGAGPHQRLAVQQVGADRADHHARPLGHRAQRLGVGGVGVQQRQLGQRRVLLRQPVAHRHQLAGVAPGERPPAALRGVLGEVAGDQLTGEAGRPEEHDVELPVGLPVGLPVEVSVGLLVGLTVLGSGHGATLAGGTGRGQQASHS
jgi:hypothetical protein